MDGDSGHITFVGFSLFFSFFFSFFFFISFFLFLPLAGSLWAFFSYFLVRSLCDSSTPFDSFLFSRQFFLLSCSMASDVTIPLRGPRCINFFQTILSWPVIHLVVPIGVSHIYLWQQEIQPMEWEKKNKRTIRASVNSKYKKVGSVTLHSLCICRLTLACISSEISTKLLGMSTHSYWPSLTAFFCWSLSTDPLYLPSPTASSEFLFSNYFSRVPLPTSSRVEISNSGLCLVSRQYKQKDRLLGAPPS